MKRPSPSGGRCAAVATRKGSRSTRWGKRPASRPSTWAASRRASAILRSAPYYMDQALYCVGAHRSNRGSPEADPLELIARSGESCRQRPALDWPTPRRLEPAPLRPDLIRPALSSLFSVERRAQTRACVHGLRPRSRAAPSDRLSAGNPRCAVVCRERLLARWTRRVRDGLPHPNRPKRGGGARPPSW